MKIIYYSLLVSGQPSDQGRFFQLTTSIKTLRKHNANIPVQLHLIGELPKHVLSQLDKLKVKVINFPSYQSMIEEYLPGLGEWLNLYPVMHKFLTMNVLLNDPPEQVLYLDSDTYIHGDIEKVFDDHRDLDLYAREEPGTRLSPLGYHPEYLNEDVLNDVQRAESCSLVSPFNTGVVLLNHNLWQRLLDISKDYLNFVMRISLWMEANNKGLDSLPDLAFLREHKNQLTESFKGLEPITFPGSNLWIKEQMALWLTVGRIKDATTGQFDRKYVTQGCEEIREPGALSRPIISHYYSQNTQAFMSKVNSAIYKN